MTLGVVLDALLFLSAVLAGALNALAGGGTLITFPVLIWAGFPSIMANATSAVAQWPGYVAGCWAFRRELVILRGELPGFTLSAILGGLLGAGLLLWVPVALFDELVPWLILVATLLFAGGGRLARLGGEIRSGRMRLGMHVLVSGYGGFFGGGLGILLLAYYRLLALSDFKRMTALKLWVSTLIASASVVSFAWGGLVDWRAGGVMIGGTVVGGLLGAKLARFLPPEWLRRGVILTGLVLTATFFHRTYA
ncbi:hypothetical protein A9J41_02540 [Laribacter hongkongensis]|nr:hypothetical protein [Laribacter hongkongensis]